MNKLIELLNEYDEGGNWRKLHWKGLGCEDHDTIGYKDKELTCEQDEIIAYMISKSYGFIKRLVDNDKIDLYKAKGNSDRIYYKEYGSGGFTCSNEEFVLMLLSISDTPIDDLISYLR